MKPMMKGGIKKQRLHKWHRILLGLTGLLVATWLFVSSGFFLKLFVLPRLGVAFNGELSAGTASWSPLSSLRLGRFKFLVDGQTEPLLTAGELHIEYDLFTILGGTIKLGSVELDQPTLRLAKSVDGSTSIDSILSKLNEPPLDPSADGTTRIDIGTIVVKNADILMTTDLANGRQDKLQIRLANFSTGRLANGNPSKLNVSGAVTVSKPDSGKITSNGSLSCTIQVGDELEIGHFGAALDLTQTTGTGFFEPLNNCILTANLDAALPEIRNLDLTVDRDEARIVEINVSGKLAPGTLESDLAIQAMFQSGEWLLPLPGLDLVQLQIATQASLDVQVKTTSNANNFEVNGKLTGADTSLLANRKPNAGLSKKEKTSGVNLELDFAVKADLNGQSATFDQLQFTAIKSGNESLSATINKPMTLGWGESVAEDIDSSLVLRIDEFNLAEWPSFVGQFAEAGIVNGKLNLNVANGGKSIEGQFNSNVSEITLTGADPKLAGTHLEIEAAGKLSDWEILSADKLYFTLGKGETTWATFDGLATGSSGQFTVKGRGELSLPVVANLAAVPGLIVKNGGMSYTATLNQVDDQLSIDTTANIIGFTGGYSSWHLADWDLALNSQVGIGDELVTLKETTLELTQQDKLQGKLEIAGTLPLGQAPAKVSVAATGVLADMLNALAKPWLDPIQVTLSQTETRATIDFNDEGSIAADFTGSLGQLMLVEANTPILSTPLTIGMSGETKLTGDLIELTKVNIALPESARAENQVTATGKIVAPAGRDIVSNLKLFSDGMDLTALNKLLPAVPVAESNQKTGSNFVADLAGLPELFTGMALDLQIELVKAFWEELTLTEAKILANATGTTIDLHNIEFELNGMPVSGKIRIDKSKPKPSYALEVEMKELPAQPLVDSFGPEVKGTLAGNITFLTKLNSSGGTEAEFWQNLNGYAELKFAKGDLRLFSDTTQMLLTPIAIMLRLPQLLSSPIDTMHARLKIAGRVIQIEKCEVRGNVFSATTRGKVPLEKIFADSQLNLPVEFSLKRDLADRAGLIPSGTPLSAKFVKLPDFITIRGTVGEPKTKTNKLAILGILGQSAVSLPGSVETQAGSILENAADILSGEFIGGSVKDALGNRGKDLFKDINRIVGGKDDKNHEKPVNPLLNFGPIFAPESSSNKKEKPKE